MQLCVPLDMGHEFEWCDALWIDSHFTTNSELYHIRIQGKKGEHLVSTASLYPTSKPENAIYLAFGTSLALWLERWLIPHIFEDLASALTITVLLGSIIASILFYIKLDRAVTWLLKKRTYKKYGLDMTKVIVQTHIAIETWRMKVVEVWEEPEERSLNALDRLFKGRDIHDDIWSLNGAFYFSCSIAFLLYSATITLDRVLFFSGVLIVIVWAFIIINYSGFIERCSRIALFRIMQEQYSVFKARDPGDRPSRNWFIGTSEQDEAPIDLVLNELEHMIELRDWSGFIRRFKYLEQELAKWFDDVEISLHLSFIKKWAQIVEEKDSILSVRYHEQTKFLKRILLSAISQNLLKNPEIVFLLQSSLAVDDAEYFLNPSALFMKFDNFNFDSIHSLDEQVFLDSLSRAFNTYVSGMLEEEVVQIVLDWYSEGCKQFENGLLKAILSCSRNLAKSVVKEFIKQADLTTWRNAGSRVALIMVEIRNESIINIPSSIIAQMLKSERIFVMQQLLPFLVPNDNEILQEYVLLQRSANPAISDNSYQILKDLPVERLLPVLQGYIVHDQSTLRAASILFLLRITKERTLPKGLLSDLLGTDKSIELRIAILEEAIASKIGLPQDEFENIRAMTPQSQSEIHACLTRLQTGLLLYTS